MERDQENGWKRKTQKERERKDTEKVAQPL